MFGYRFQMDRLVYAHARHVKDFREKCALVYKNAAREYMKEALKHVPGYTGMSRASFTKLAAFLGEDLDLEQVAPKKYITKKKNPELGAARGGFVFEVTKDGLLKFEFQSKVAQYRINEFIDATKYRSEANRRNVGLRRYAGRGHQYFKLKRPGPYFSLTKAKNVFNAYIKANLHKKLPKIKDYIRKVGSDNVRATYTRF